MELNLIDAAGVIALMRSEETRRPLCPTEKMSLDLMARLAEIGMIECGWPEEWPPDSAVKLTPGEGVAWRYDPSAPPEWAWHAYSITHLVTASTDPETEPERTEFWWRLAEAEAESYLSYQLDKHRLNPRWATEISKYFRSVGPLPIAEWRYCAWAAARRGAAEYLSSDGDAGATSHAVLNELLWRARQIHSGAWSNMSFVPQQREPYTLIAQVFVQFVVPPGFDYWTSTPADWSRERERPAATVVAKSGQ
jgi:hypothetical protein